MRLSGARRRFVETGPGSAERRIVGKRCLHRSVNGERLLTSSRNRRHHPYSDENPTKCAFHCFRDARDATLVTAGAAKPAAQIESELVGCRIFGTVTFVNGLASLQQEDVRALAAAAS
jgi:hypothetical protein